MKHWMKTATAVAFVAYAALSLSGGHAQAQSAVFKNCNVYPCMIGVAGPGYANPGNANYAAGWRQASQWYPSNLDALRTLCRWNRWANYSSPDVASGAVNCVALCGGVGSCQ